MHSLHLTLENARFRGSGPSNGVYAGADYKTKGSCLREISLLELPGETGSSSGHTRNVKLQLV